MYCLPMDMKQRIVLGFIFVVSVVLQGLIMGFLCKRSPIYKILPFVITSPMSRSTFLFAFFNTV